MEEIGILREELFKVVEVSLEEIAVVGYHRGSGLFREKGVQGFIVWKYGGVEELAKNDVVQVLSPQSQFGQNLIDLDVQVKLLQGLVQDLSLDLSTSIGLSSQGHEGVDVVEVLLFHVGGRGVLFEQEDEDLHELVEVHLGGLDEIVDFQFGVVINQKTEFLEDLKGAYQADEVPGGLLLVVVELLLQTLHFFLGELVHYIQVFLSIPHEALHLFQHYIQFN